MLERDGSQRNGFAQYIQYRLRMLPGALGVFFATYPNPSIISVLFQPFTIFIFQSMYCVDVFYRNFPGVLSCSQV